MLTTIHTVLFVYVIDFVRRELDITADEFLWFYICVWGSNVSMSVNYNDGKVS